MAERKLGELLVERGLVPAAGVSAALASGGRLASELLRQGIASERALAKGLAEQRGHPAVVLSESALDLSALELIPRVIAEQHRLLPIAVDAESITLAVSALTTKEGRRPEIFDQIEFATGRTPRFLLGVEAAIEQATAIAYDAHRAGEAALFGATPTPEGAPQDGPLAIVRPPGAGPAARQDPLDVPSETALPADEPLVQGEPTAPAAEAAPAIAATALAGDKPVVLVVDDEDDIRALIKKVLGYDGYHVVEARSGREALDLLRVLRPALIVLDAMLPEIHGFDICATLKRSEAFANTPIIVVSAVYRGWEHARTVQETHGADAFVEKPFDVHYLRQLCARMIGRELPRAPLAADWQNKVKALREEAAVAYGMGDAPHAEDAIKRWRALDPFDANAYLMLGNVKSKTGDLDGAMKAYERAGTFDAHLFAAFKNLAVVYDQLGFVQRAQMAWYRAYELAPEEETRLRIEARLARR